MADSPWTLATPRGRVRQEWGAPPLDPCRLPSPVHLPVFPLEATQTVTNPAVQVAQHLAELIPPEKDAVEGPEILANLAEVEARTGDAGAAVKTLRQVLLLPAGMVASIERLKIDPVWDPIRNDPGFRQLLAEGKEQIGPNK